MSEAPDPARIVTRADFARELTAARELAGLSVRDVAKATNMIASTLGGYFSGRYTPTAKLSGKLPAILAACGIRDPTVVKQWIDAFERVRRSPGPRSAAADAPYRGLATYEPEDADWFCGREDLTAALVAVAVAAHTHGRMVAVVGPSGSGKSSLLRAGLIPAARRGELAVDGSAHWPVVLFTPGAQPHKELATRLGDVFAIESDSARSPDGVAPGGVIIVVDQFEEAFTACHSEEDRRTFFAELRRTARASVADENAHDPNALVLIGLRADFYGHALNYADLVPALQESQLAVGPMSERQVRRAILEPARQAKLDVEDGLVEVLLRDLDPLTGAGPDRAAHAAGALPFLSHALLSTWQRGHRRRLTVADYLASRGIHGAIAASADAVFCDLTEPEQQTAQHLFVRLVHVGDDVADTRRRVPRAELHSPADPEGVVVTYVLERFIEVRLLTADVDTVQITHEALLTAWPRLRAWLDTDREWLRLHRELNVAAAGWHEAHRDPDLLYRGARLAAARDWTADPAVRGGLNERELAFLHNSVERDLADRGAGRRRQRRLQRLVGALAVLLVMTGTLAGYSASQRRMAEEQRADAREQRDLAVSRQIALTADRLRSSDPVLAAQMSVAAFRVAPTVEARSRLIEASNAPTVTRLVRPSGVPQSIAVTANGALLAAAGAAPADTHVLLWDLARQHQPQRVGPALTGHTAPVYAATFSPDGSVLATAGGDRAIRLWNVADMAAAMPIGEPLTGPTNTVYSLAFSSNGHLLAAGSADGNVHLFDVTNPEQPARIAMLPADSGAYVHAVVFSPNGRSLAAGDAAGSVQLWNLTEPRRPITIGRAVGLKSKVFTVAFDPNGRTLATGTATGEARIWNVTEHGLTADTRPRLADAASFVNAVTFSPDGRQLAVASADRTVRVFDVSTRTVTNSMAHSEPVTGVAFLNDQTLTSSAADGVARIWDLTGPTITGATKTVANVTLSDSGQTLSVASSDNRVAVWDATTPRDPRQLGVSVSAPAKYGDIIGVASLSPDGRTVAAGTRTGRVLVWDMTNPGQPKLLPPPTSPLTDLIESVDFSPDGRLLAAGSDDGAVGLWDVTDLQRPVQLAAALNPDRGAIFMVTFSPDGRTLAAAAADSAIVLWDVTDSRQPHQLAALPASDNDYMYSAAFSASGHTLAGGSAAGTIHLWDTSDIRRPVELGEPLKGPDGYVLGLTFSQHGSTLAASTSAGQVWLWDLASPDRPRTIATVQAAEHPVFSVAIAADGHTIVTGSADKTARLWDIDPELIAARVCTTSGTPINADEWGQYLPGVPYEPPCRPS